MALHSTSYIRDMVGHSPNNMLQLRTDEVQVFNRMGVDSKRRISFPSRLADIRETAWLKENEMREEREDNNNNGWRRIKVCVEDSSKEVSPTKESDTQGHVMFTYHNVQRKNCLLEEMEEENQDLVTNLKLKSGKSENVKNRRKSDLNSVKNLQAEARRRFSVGDPCFQYPSNPYVDSPPSLYIAPPDRLNYILEEEEETRKEDDNWNDKNIIIEEEDFEGYEECCDDVSNYIVEEEDDEEMRRIPIVIENSLQESRQRRNTRIEDTNSIRELIKDLSSELDQLKQNRQLLENLKNNTTNRIKKVEKSVTTYAELVGEFHGDRFDNQNVGDSLQDSLGNNLDLTTNFKPIHSVNELDKKDDYKEIVIKRKVEDKNGDIEDDEKYELMSDPSSCDELWLLPQQVLAMDVELLQEELSFSCSPRELLRFARASPSKSTFWMYSVQGRLRAC